MRTWRFRKQRCLQDSAAVSRPFTVVSSQQRVRAATVTLESVFLHMCATCAINVDDIDNDALSLWVTPSSPGTTPLSNPSCRSPVPPLCLFLMINNLNWPGTSRASVYTDQSRQWQSLSHMPERSSPWSPTLPPPLLWYLSLIPLKGVRHQWVEGKGRNKDKNFREALRNAI